MIVETFDADHATTPEKLYKVVIKNWNDTISDYTETEMVNCADHDTMMALIPGFEGAKNNTGYNTLRQAGLTSKDVYVNGKYVSTRGAFCPPDGSILYQGQVGTSVEI